MNIPYRYSSSRLPLQSYQAMASRVASRADLSINVKYVQTEEKLYEYIPRGVYTGGTIDPERRANEHEGSLNLSGRRVMYCWKTRNSMKKAENRLLKGRSFRLNNHNVSNAADGPGYVYIIV